MIYKNLQILTAKFNDKSGILNEQIAVIATIIIKIGLTKFALTAASPKINPPTIPIVGPILGAIVGAIVYTNIF